MGFRETFMGGKPQPLSSVKQHCVLINAINFRILETVFPHCLISMLMMWALQKYLFFFGKKRYWVLTIVILNLNPLFFNIQSHVFRLSLKSSDRQPFNSSYFRVSSHPQVDFIPSSV